MSLVFINCTSETFTPTKSGAIATVLWEVCQIAKAEGISPTIITCPADAEPYPWENLIIVEKPPEPVHPWAIAFFRLQRRLDGHRYLRQKAWTLRVIAKVRERGLDKFPLFFHNDPEMAVLFRKSFPTAKIIHHFHNQHTSKEKMRQLFGEAKIDVTAVSSSTARWIEEFYRLPPQSVATIHNGVNSETFHPQISGRSGPIVINFAGRTGIEKAPDLLLKAALILSEKRQDFALQVVGGNHWGHTSIDDYQRELQSLTAQLEARGIAVNFTGFVVRNKMPEAFHHADIHVVPSRWDEPCALTIFEGMASGLAVVTSRTGGSPEILGNAGLLFERDDATDLAAQLEKLLSDRDFRLEMARKARERATQLTWAATWEKMKIAAGITSDPSKNRAQV